jgi:hypothetical protein
MDPAQSRERLGLIAREAERLGLYRHMHLNEHERAIVDYANGVAGDLGSSVADPIVVSSSHSPQQPLYHPPAHRI